MRDKYLKEWQNRCNRDIHAEREYYAMRPEYVGRSLTSIIEEFPNHFVDEFMGIITVEIPTLTHTLSLLIKNLVCIEALAFENFVLEHQPERDRIPLVEDIYLKEPDAMKNTLVCVGKNEPN